MKKKLLLLILISTPLLLNGCAKIWRPVFILGKKTDPVHFEKLPYYNGPHELCRYEGSHVHDPKLGPISVMQPTSEKEITEKYRYPGMQERFIELDERAW